jgi:hypothetical protein
MKDSAARYLEDESYFGGEDSFFFTSLIGDTGGG